MAGKAATPGTAYIGLGACLAIIMVGPFNAFVQGGLTPILPLISAEYADEPAADILSRLMISGLRFMMIFGSFMAGFIAERMGQRKLLLWSLAAIAILGAMGGLFDNLYLIVATRLAIGVANAIAGVMAAAIIATRVAPDGRDKWLGYLTMAGTFGGVVSILVVGALGSIDWRLVFYLHLIAFAVLAWICATLPPPLEPGFQAAEIASVEGGFPWQLGVLSVLIGVGLSAYLIFVPFQMDSIGFGDPTSVALVMSSSALGAALFSYAFGWMRARWSASLLFTAGLLLNAMGLALTATASGLVMAMVGMSLVGAGVGIMAPNLTSITATVVVPERRSRAMGLMRAGMACGPILAQVPLEPIEAIFGVVWTLWVLVAFAILAIPVSIGLNASLAERSRHIVR